MINDSSNQNISYLVSRYIPQFILDEYPNFRLFLETYYEYCQQNGKYVPYNMIRNIENWADVDTTLEAFVDYFKKEYIDLPDIDDWELYIKHYKEIYQSKGSTKALQLLLKLLSSGTTDIEYPNRVLMKSSDGVYRSYDILYCSLDSSIDYDSYISTTVTGITSGATGIVENIEIYDGYIKVFLSSKEGTFVNENIKFNNGTTFNTTIYNIVDKLNIVSKGNNYKVNDEITIANNSEFKAKIASISSGILDNITITNGGSGYQAGDLIVITSASKAEYHGLPIVTIQNVDNNGAITKVKILYKGYGLQSAPYVSKINTTAGTGATFTLTSNDAGSIKSIIITNTTHNATSSSTVNISSTTGSGASLTCNIGYSFKENPYYYKGGSFLSDIYKLQDSYYYQEYSYVLNVSSTLLEKYKELFHNVMHPAGFAYFTNTILENYISKPTTYIDSTLESVQDEELLKVYIDNYIELLHYSDRIRYNGILFDIRETELADIQSRILSTFNNTGGNFVSSSLETTTD